MHCNDEQQNKITYSILLCCSLFGCIFSKMLRYIKFTEDMLVFVILHEKCEIKFAEDKVFVFVVLCRKCENTATVSLTLTVTLSRLIR